MAAESPDPGAAAVALPKKFGPYRVVRRLGRGGMGVVYLAEDTRLSRLVALKVCKVSTTDAPILERFRREARSAAALRHPNLCPVYEFEVRDGIPYLAMAYIDGPTLSEWMTERVPLEPRTAAMLVAKLATGMKAAHANGVIHRDLKPGNILLEKGEPVIVDFGLARQTDANEHMTKKGAVIGTPSYMAPEQVRGDDVLGPGCDVYALGIILYELLAGRRPFEGPPGIVLAQILYTPASPPSKHRPDLDPRLEAVCLKAMAKTVEERYASMTELAQALAPLTKISAAPAPRGTRRRSKVVAPDTQAVQEPPTLPGTTPAPRSATPSSGSVLHILLLLICCAALGAVVSFPWWKDHLPLGNKAVEDNHKPIERAPSFTNSVDMKLMLIQPGSFLMGSPESDASRFRDELSHPVEIGQPFFLGAFEVTQEQFEKVLGKERNPSFFTTAKGGGPNCPVENVTWAEAVEFCQRLSDAPEEKKKRRVYRLPTEAEWEYACRADTTGPYNFGAITGLPSHAWFRDNSESRTHPVGGKPANGWGLHDMHGNVSEWCQDWYQAQYARPGQQDFRVARGGSWSSVASTCRSANRGNAIPDRRFDTIGFRVAATYGSGK